MAFPATMKYALSISLSVGAILSGISRGNGKFELSLESPGQGVFVRGPTHPIRGATLS